MKTRKSTMKKVLSTTAVLMLLTASHAHAGAVSFLNGQVNFVEPGFVPNTINGTSPVSLNVTWNDMDILGTGMEELDLIGAGNTISFTVGSMTFDQNDTGPVDFAPVAHFTNGLFDGVYLLFDEVIDVFDGFSGAWSPRVAWNYDIDTGVFTGGGGMGAFDILEWDSFTFMDGTTGAPSAVPIPGAIWLLGSGLVGLAQLRRKNK